MLLKDYSANRILSYRYLGDNAYLRLLKIKFYSFLTSNYYLCARPNEDEAHWSIVWKSVVKSKTLTPTWSQEKIPLQTLCNGDRLCPLLVEVYDYKRNGKHVFMGKMETNVLGLLQVGEPKILVEPAKVGTLKGYVNSGTLTSSDAILLEKPTFLDVKKSQKLDALFCDFMYHVLIINYSIWLAAARYR